ncbi:hypothetical protein AGMMS50225_18280 [Betaproteobacteria bacterium]|nr:hypothetical protein AGMMS50225_18280 [Betaproteobacteria bacterium]
MDTHLLYIVSIPFPGYRHVSHRYRHKLPPFAQRTAGCARVQRAKGLLHACSQPLPGRTLSEFVIDSAQEAADRVVREHEIVRLSREEQIAFVSALLDPPEVSEPLRRAVADYRRKVGV